MKKLILTALFLFIFNLPCLADQYKVLHVVEGDTIDIDYNGKKERIRMLGVDTPESVHPDVSKNTPLGKLASNYTENRLAGEYVSLEFEGSKRDNHGRLLSYIFLNGENYHTEFVVDEKEVKAKELNIGVAKQQRSIQTLLTTATKYHGNRKSYKFHKPSCRYYNCKNCTRIFNSRQAAIKAGYIPCKICKP